MRKTTWLCAVAAFAAACAPDVVRQPSSLVDPAPAARSFQSEERVVIDLDSGYRRSIPAGAQFIEAGSIAAGVVLRPTNTVISVEGAHVHEAYPVLKDGRLVGFYLPVERAFSPLSTPPRFPLTERKVP
jgi:hypothetical protein